MIFFKALIVFGHLWLAAGVQNTYTVSLPNNIHVFVGSCALVPCAFNISDFESKLNQSGSLHAAWIKGGSKFANNPVVYNGTTNATKLFERVEVTGDLRQKDCSTVFYNVNESHHDIYFFRTEMTTFNATFIDKSFSLVVEDSPASPRVSGPSEVAEGSSVNLTCTAAAPCPYQPPNITWSLHSGDISTHIQYEGDGTKTLVSFLTFTASRTHHEREIFCMASYRRQDQSTVEANRTEWALRVLFSPAVVEASVSPSGAVAEGSIVTLTCNSSEANPPVHNYTWFRDTQTSPVRSGPNITFNVSSSHAGLYYCRAEHPQGGKGSNRVELKVQDEEKTTSALLVGLIVGGSLAVLLVALLIFVISRNKSTTLQEEENTSQHETSAACDGDRPVQANGCEPTEDEKEEIHYAEIDFSKSSLGDSSAKAELEQGQETEYAEVHLSGRGSQTDDQADTHAKTAQTDQTDQTGTGNGELYAQVQK
ncbi:hypothetical protein ACEWY4_018807 [Coilia grayii]|uniref:Ig-like domain-containing protein n=1 Tax=Coilia grayii TaxID=363190 RepID=A0ABD1JE85_9TELE